MLISRYASEVTRSSWFTCTHKKLIDAIIFLWANSWLTCFFADQHICLPEVGKFIVGAEPSIKFKPAKSQGIWLHLRTLQQRVTECLLRRGRSQFMFPLKETAFKNRKEASSFETDDCIFIVVSRIIVIRTSLGPIYALTKKTTTDLYLSQKQTTCWKQQQFCYDGTKVNLIRRKLVVYISKISGEK